MPRGGGSPRGVSSSRAVPALLPLPDLDVAEADFLQVQRIRGLSGFTELDGCFDRFIGRATEADVGLHPVAPFYMKPPRKSGLLLGYASLTENQIREGVRRIAASMRS